MIRDPQFNPLFAPQLPPWSAQPLCSPGYIIPLYAVRSEIPADEIAMSIAALGGSTPEDLLAFYASFPTLTLVQGTWTTIHTLLCTQPTPPLSPSSDVSEASVPLVSPVMESPALGSRCPPSTSGSSKTIVA